MLDNIKRLLRYDLPLHIVLLLTNWLPDMVNVLRLRGYLASFFLGQCGKDLRLGRNITFYNPKNMIIGKNVYIAYGSWFSASETILIEDEVIIGPYLICSSANHTKQVDSYRYGPPVKEKITIQTGSWIGGHCIILAGVKIGSSTLIGAGSVVTKSIEANSLSAGNPAKIIKKI